ncbi:uncharacterized protein SAPINGB_P000754 [Magnusiomyces paraingens]|uniref:4a-hydroxytetrahydrobiopterin dehydratase n=1 Tax=Magnusiomyces paraingens TaxID=2606893 RepID=A0A5E8B2X7_9ASCO|nr:uncharacterized protein SAPINGB_P000754 [Saprochaete ingens]VVT45450.1 unnamed protein product [Saprochaete ingens]
MPPPQLSQIISAGWFYNAGSQTLSKTFTFANGFLPTWAFLQQLALYSHRAQHHPHIATKYNVVTLELHTDDEHSISDKDIKMAKKADSLFFQLTK